ncbi:3-oxoacyl-ACP reductase FabG [Kushneria aurantia]|uniref:3-oxoacyl-ACP reductase FabG n=1 Tax=Kushneria aurantia TaxID=504092 RepID=A0ABV6FZG0_9GAMM|nr:3-oxoacyl-ACP reductase FabG [Kushneria aurantia]
MTNTILVTGASRGIGRACALRLAADGFDIVVHYKSRECEAREVCAEIEALGRCARRLAFDVGEREQARQRLEADIAEHGAYYGVVLNAGLHHDAPFPGMRDEQWDSVLNVDLGGFYNVLRPLVMPMIQRRRGGRIVALSSAAGQVGNRGQVNYAAAKGGVIAALKSLALELAKRRITVNGVAPGWIDTDMTAGSDVEIKKVVPMQRMGSAEEVAGVVSFLCSPDSAYVTRQVIAVNGGLY